MRHILLVYLLLIAVLVVISFFHYSYGRSKTVSPRATADEAEESDKWLKGLLFLMLIGGFVFLALIFVTDY